VSAYFAVANGRLKLRETEGEPAVLIWYSRPNQVESRTSRYHLVPAPDPLLLKDALSAAQGIRTVVAKRRELYLYHNVRIHLDEVESLGSFLEFEAVLEPGESEEEGHRLLAELRQHFRIEDEALIADSYVDLQLRTKSANDEG
jgi:adenylate cyclase class IV